MSDEHYYLGYTHPTQPQPPPLKRQFTTNTAAFLEGLKHLEPDFSVSFGSQLLKWVV